MTGYIPILVIAFASTLLVCSYYWTVVHPILVRQIVYRLFERRDKLRNMAIQGDIAVQSDDYQEVEEIICKTIDYRSSMTLGSFLWASLCHAKEIDELDTVESSCKETEAMRAGIVSDALLFMSLNSPFVFGVMAVSAGVLWVFGRFNRMLVLKRAVVFMDNLPPSSRGMELA